MSVPSLLFGILAVLGPLHLSHAGWGAAAIGGVWLVGAGLEALQAPIVGRISDRRGPLVPVRVALAAGALVSLGLATGARPLFYAPLIVIAAISYGVLFTPAFAMIANGAEQHRPRAGNGVRLDERGVGDGRRGGPLGGRRDRERDGRLDSVRARVGAVRIDPARRATAAESDRISATTSAIARAAFSRPMFS